MSISFVLDATHQNIGSIPAGTIAALYTTGTPDIRATPADLARNPNAIRICQDHGSDDTADILDMENGAATPQNVVDWLPKARHSFNTNKRHGQRWPGVYLSRSRVTEQANALVKANLSNVPLWIADWGEAQITAIGELVAATGPFPIVGLQIRNQVVNDFSVFSDAWLNKRSGMATPTHPNPNESFKVNTPPPLEVKTGTPAIAFGFGPQGKLLWFTVSEDGHTWSDPKPVNG